jgi:hypothetical protein
MKITKLLILFLLLSLKGFSQQAPSYTLKYEKIEFCAGSNEFAKPIILNSKGEVIEKVNTSGIYFSIIKVLGEGNLVVDKYGVIDIRRSNSGSYKVIINTAIGTAIVRISSFDIKVKNCK